MIPDPNFLYFFLMVGGILGVQWLPRTPRYRLARQGLLYGFGFANGWAIGPVLRQTLRIDPSIPLTALIGSSVIFLSFTMTALLTNRRSQLYLGGLLSAATSALLWMGLANAFLGSARLFTAEIYIGLLMFAGYILYDTQMMVERSEAGVRDVPGDAMALFINMFAVFVRLLALLNQDRGGGRRRRGRNRNSDDSD